MGDGEGLNMTFLYKNFKILINKKVLAKRWEKINEKPQCYDVKVSYIWEMNVWTPWKKWKLKRKRKRKKKKKQKDIKGHNGEW